MVSDMPGLKRPKPAAQLSESDCEIQFSQMILRCLVRLSETYAKKDPPEEVEFLPRNILSAFDDYVLAAADNIQTKGENTPEVMRAIDLLWTEVGRHAATHKTPSDWEREKRTSFGYLPNPRLHGGLLGLYFARMACLKSPDFPEWIREIGILLTQYLKEKKKQCSVGNSNAEPGESFESDSPVQTASAVTRVQLSTIYQGFACCRAVINPKFREEIIIAELPGRILWEQFIYICFRFVVHQDRGLCTEGLVRECIAHLDVNLSHRKFVNGINVVFGRPSSGRPKAGSRAVIDENQIKSPFPEVSKAFASVGPLENFFKRKYLATTSAVEH